MGSEARGRRGRSTSRDTRGRSVASRCWKWAASVAVLVTVLLAEYGFLHERIAADAAELLAGQRRAPQAEAAVRPVAAPPAPASAGDVMVVQARALSPCSPGASCAVRVYVGLVPRPSPVLVRWDMRIEDLCSGVKTAVAGGSVTVPPRADRADVVGRFVLPTGSALAVTAVTTAPAVAAGAPMRVGAPPSCSRVG